MTKLQLSPESLVPLNDAQLAVVVPVCAYWIVSLVFHLINEWGLFQKYRIYSPQDQKNRNLAGKKQVFVSVLWQQAVQVAVGLVVGHYEASTQQDDLTNATRILSILQQEVNSHLPKSWDPILFRLMDVAATALFYGVRQLLAFLVIDSWQFWIHRLEHVNPWIYRNVHSHHHRLYTPYAYGALYNHPLETFFLDTLGGLVSSWSIGLSNHEAMFFLTLSTIKTVDDHCGYQLPWDIIQWFGRLTGNDVIYHNVHHQSWGLKTNFALFFTFWDDLISTRYYGPARLGRTDARSKNL